MVDVVWEVGRRHPVAVANSAPASYAIHVGILYLRAIRRDGFDNSDVASVARRCLSDGTDTGPRTDCPATGCSIVGPGVGVTPVVWHGNAAGDVVGAVTIVVTVRTILG